MQIVNIQILIWIWREADFPKQEQPCKGNSPREQSYSACLLALHNLHSTVLETVHGDQGQTSSSTRGPTMKSTHHGSHTWAHSSTLKVEPKHREVGLISLQCITKACEFSLWSTSCSSGENRVAWPYWYLMPLSGAGGTWLWWSFLLQQEQSNNKVSVSL